MTIKCYGPTGEAQEKISKQLGIPATKDDQDWELVFADPKRIGDMLTLGETGKLDLDALTALSLLIIRSAEEARRLTGENVERIKHLLESNVVVKERMRFFFLELDKAEKRNLVARILSQ